MVEMGVLGAGGEVRVAPGVSLLCVGEAVHLRSPDARAEVAIPARHLSRLLTVLKEAQGWRTRSTLRQLIIDATGESERAAEVEVERLIAMQILEVKEGDRRDEKSQWGAFGWADAYDFHRHVGSLQLIDWSKAESVAFDIELMREYLRNGVQPDAYLERASIARQRVPLPTERFESVNCLLPTITREVGADLTATDLVTIVSLSFAQTASRILPVTGTHVSKTSPSGGSRHPTEAYVVLLRPVGHFGIGLFHFNVKETSMDQLDALDHTFDVRRDLIRFPDRPAFEPSAAIVLVSEIERSMFRYRESRSYRVLHYDVGHLGQTLGYVASALGRPSYRGYTVREQSVVGWLGLEPLREIPLAFAIL